MNCKNCGAPLKSHICEYCNTDNKYIHGYGDGNEVIIHFQDRDIRCTIETVEMIDVSGENGRYVTPDGHIGYRRSHIIEMRLVSEPIPG